MFLVDFGLASKYKDNLGFHHDGGEDERFAHEGTLEYTSRDAHIGAHSRRGDLETLGSVVMKTFLIFLVCTVCTLGGVS